MKKNENSWHNPYAVGCLAVVVLLGIIGIAVKECDRMQQKKVEPEQVKQEKVEPPKKPLFESVDELKNAFNENIKSYEKSSKLKLKKIERINVENNEFADELSKGGSHTVIQVLTISGNVDNGRIWNVSIQGGTNAIGMEAQVGMELTPYVVSLIRSVDKSILDFKEAGSIYGELLKDFKGFKSFSKNGYKYMLGIISDRPTIIGFTAEAIP